MSYLICIIRDIYKCLGTKCSLKADRFGVDCKIRKVGWNMLIGGWYRVIKNCLLKRIYVNKIRVICPSLVLWESDIQTWPLGSLCDQQRAVHTSKKWFFSSWEDDDHHFFVLNQKRNIVVHLKVHQLPASNWWKLWVAKG